MLGSICTLIWGDIVHNSSDRMFNHKHNRFHLMCYLSSNPISCRWIRSMCCLLYNWSFMHYLHKSSLHSMFWSYSSLVGWIFLCYRTSIMYYNQPCRQASVLSLQQQLLVLLGSPHLCSLHKYSKLQRVYFKWNCNRMYCWILSCWQWAFLHWSCT